MKKTLSVMMLAAFWGCERSNRPDPVTSSWPPVLGKPYPALQMMDHEGKPFELSSLRGKIILIEPIGMDCPACQAFCGGNTKGGLGGVTPQSNLPSLEDVFAEYTGDCSYSDERIAHVQILFYNMTKKPTTSDDARMWSKHFGISKSKKQFVLAGSKGLLGPSTYNMIPGFQLIDKDFILRADSTGHHPKHNLYTELLPMVANLLTEK